MKFGAWCIFWVIDKRRLRPHFFSQGLNMNLSHARKWDTHYKEEVLVITPCTSHIGGQTYGIPSRAPPTSAIPHGLFRTWHSAHQGKEQLKIGPTSEGVPFQPKHNCRFNTSWQVSCLNITPSTLCPTPPACLSQVFGFRTKVADVIQEEANRNLTSVVGEHPKVVEFQHGIRGVQGVDVIWHIHVHDGLTKLHYYLSTAREAAKNSPAVNHGQGFLCKERHPSPGDDKSLPSSARSPLPVPGEKGRGRSLPRTESPPFPGCICALLVLIMWCR